ncbi:hypothetical protein [Bradyrhizobium sp. McL0615]|uniref:hypothetical protein n=1 Tax=Bradyrhizobium sp. McL0615 TaxID=3415673 RepID=UPI003CF8ADCB
MTARKKPFLAVVDGTTLPPPAGPRNGKRSASDREGTAIAVAHTIEQLLPALVELNRVWAIGATAAGAYHEARATTDAERYHRIPVPLTEEVEAIREMSGARVVECAMTILHGKLRTMYRLVENAPVATLEGLRTKTLAAMYECMPSFAEHEGGFDFGENDEPVRMLFRACISVTGLSELAARLEARMDRERGATS